MGTEIALDIATHFPEKKVEWLSGSDTLMSRIHGFHEATMEVVEREAAKGYLKLSLGERATSVDQAGSILTDKGNETTPGARAYWCTGYRANNFFMKDPRTAASVASCLDDEGFINAGPTHQPSHPARKRLRRWGHMLSRSVWWRRADGRLRARARISHLREHRTARRYEIGPAAGYDAPWYPDRTGGRNRQ